MLVARGIIRPAGRLRNAVFGGIAACALASVMISAGWIAERQQASAENERLALYWNRYAANYYEAFGGWNGIAERLNADAGDYPDQPLSVILLDEHERVKASYGDEQGDGALTRKPIVEGDRIVGYTVTGMQQAVLPSGGVMMASFLAASASLVLWLLIAVRREREWKSLLERLYGQATRLLPSTSASDDASTEGLAEARIENKIADALTEAMQYIQKLETVRRSMVADIAHELRTPLAVMRSQLDNALRAGAPLPLEKAAAMYDELLLLTKLVHDLQELALAEAGKLPLEKEWFSLQALTGLVVDALQVEAEERGVRLILEAPQAVSVYADRARIRQLIVNLTGNALRHARRQVTLVLHYSATHVVLVVQDDGLGMEEEQLAHIFERFYRGTGSLANKGMGAGLGLGLSIVKQYAEAHGGVVGVTSRWGEGTSFRIELPVIKE